MATTGTGGGSYKGASTNRERARGRNKAAAAKKSSSAKTLPAKGNSRYEYKTVSKTYEGRQVLVTKARLKGSSGSWGQVAGGRRVAQIGNKGIKDYKVKSVGKRAGNGGKATYSAKRKG